MLSGDIYLDTMVKYFPSSVSREYLLMAIKSRFPKQAHFLNMNSEQLLKFYLKHIFPRPQRKEPKKAIPRPGRKREPKKEEENKYWLYPCHGPRFRNMEINHNLWVDSHDAELDDDLSSQGERAINPEDFDPDDSEDLSEEGSRGERSTGEPGPSSSQAIDLKRNTSEESNDKEPAKRQRSEIKWP